MKLFKYTILLSFITALHLFAHDAHFEGLAEKAAFIERMHGNHPDRNLNKNANSFVSSTCYPNTWIGKIEK